MATKKAAVKEAVFRNRIKRHGTAKVEDILFNPHNWRIHPQGQQEALEGALEEVGWVQSVIINETTGHLIDGHARVMLADRADEETVPAVYVELTEEEEKLVLATLDPIAALAFTDDDKLAQLLDGLEPSNTLLQELLDTMAVDAGMVPDDFDPGLPTGGDLPVPDITGEGETTDRLIIVLDDGDRTELFERMGVEFDDRIVVPYSQLKWLD